MPLKTFDVELTCDRDLHPNAPDSARVEVAPEDVAKWKTCLKFLTAHGLYSIESLDYRCNFINKYDDNEAELPVPVKVAFRQDTARSVVTQKGVMFTGFQKDGGMSSVWETTVILWSEIDAAF